MTSVKNVCCGGILLRNSPDWWSKRVLLTWKVKGYKFKKRGKECRCRESQRYTAMRRKHPSINREFYVCFEKNALTLCLVLKKMPWLCVFLCKNYLIFSSKYVAFVVSGVNSLKNVQKMYRQMCKYNICLQNDDLRSKAVTIRIPVRVIEGYKKKAASDGVGYQTLMNEVLEAALG